jgi:uncharacterized protein (TIGR02118 family)
MVRISILYPNSPNVRFDFDYYIAKHMPRSIELLGAHPGFKGVSVERGQASTAPNQPPAYIAMCHFLFESTEAFLAAFMPHASELQGDIPNYTDSQAVVQINDVLIYK